MMKQTRRDFLNLIGKVTVVAAGVALVGPKALPAHSDSKIGHGIKNIANPRPVKDCVTKKYVYSGLKEGDFIEITCSVSHDGTYRIGKQTSAGRYNFYPSGGGGSGGTVNALLMEV